ncbi:MAG: hypothetical protein QM749_15350 [Aquabacterium sp.]
MKKIIAFLAFLFLAGCTSTFKNQTDAQTDAVLNDFAGRYEVMQKSGSKDFPFDALNVTFSKNGRGFAARYSADGKRLSEYMLFHCGIANQAQAENFGDPVEFVENIIRCDIADDYYQYARIYIAKVRDDYSIKSKAWLPSFQQINIHHGYVINIETSPGSTLYVDARKGERMAHDFHNLYVSREKKFSAGIDRATEKHYVSFLEVTANRRSEIEVYFELPIPQVELLEDDSTQLEDFVNQCKQGLHADLQIHF